MNNLVEEKNNRKLYVLIAAMSKRFAQRICEAQKTNYHFPASNIEAAFAELIYDIDIMKQELADAFMLDHINSLKHPTAIRTFQKWLGER